MDRYECSNNEYMMDPGYDGVVELKDHVMSCGDGYWNGQDETGTALQQQEGILINPEFMTSMAMAQQGYDTTWGFEGTQSHFTASPELLHGFMFNPNFAIPIEPTFTEPQDIALPIEPTITEPEACSLEELISQAASSALFETSSTSAQRPSPPVGAPREPKAMKFQRRMSRAEAQSLRIAMEKPVAKKTAKRDDDTKIDELIKQTNRLASALKRSPVRKPRAKAVPVVVPAVGAVRCYNCDENIGSHTTMECTNGCGHCGKKGHETIKCPALEWFVAMRKNGRTV